MKTTQIHPKVSTKPKFQDINVRSYDFQVAITKVLHLFLAKAAQDPNTNIPAHLTEILTEVFLQKERSSKALTNKNVDTQQKNFYKSKVCTINLKTSKTDLIPDFFQNWYCSSSTAPAKLNFSAHFQCPW